MTRGREATVVVASEVEGAVLPPSVGRALGVSDGDPVVVTVATGGRQVARARTDPGATDGRVRLDETIAASLGVTDGAQVTLEPADPGEAERVVVAPVPDLSVRGGETAVAQTFRGRSVMAGTTVAVPLLDGTLDVPFRVTEAYPAGVVTVGPETDVEIAPGPAGDPSSGTVAPVPSSAVGGYDATVRACRSTVVTPLTDRDAYTVDGEFTAAGVLLEGQAGVGKTHHVRHAAWLADAALLRVDATRVARGSHADTAEYLDGVAARSDSHPRAVVHVDELDALEGGPDGADGPARQLGAWVERVRGQEGTVVVGETVDASDLPGAVTRGGRLSRLVSVPRPDAETRTAVLSTLTRGLSFGPGVDLETVGRRTLGYVAADLADVRARLVEAALDRPREGGDPTVTAADVETALEDTSPSTVPLVDASVPSVSFDDVGGLREAKRELIRAVEWPLSHGEALEHLGVDAPSGVLLYGPPGTGKTMLARAVASSTDANFFAVNGPELFNKFVGESERAIRRLFEQARDSAPAVVFFDELDALGAERADSDTSAPERVVSQLLTELDGLRARERVTVIGATNRPDRIDEALRRPGRFDRTVAVPLPDREARAEIVRIHASDKPVSGVDVDALAARTEGYSGSDIAALLQEASLLALEDRLRDVGGSAPDSVVTDGLTVTQRHVERALERVSPSTTGDEGRDYS